MLVKWCGAPFNRLFTGGIDTVIHSWDVQNMKETSVRDGLNLTKQDADNCHKDYIMDLLPIPDLQLLASAGLDKKICLWKMDENLTPKSPLIGHMEGVYSLDWFADNHMILSAGLDHDVFIWNPHVPRRIF